MDIEKVEQEVLELYNEGKWNEIVALSYTFNRAEKCRLFWVLPTINDLCWLNDIIKKHDLAGLVSIGCGCGLFEWLYQRYSGLDVIGVELDQSWWRSKYAPPIFLKNVIFIKESKTQDFNVSAKYALLFCYFNSAAAFSTYIKNYEGNLVIVIGPLKGEGRWTDPLPFDEKFERYGWKIIGAKEVGRTKDYITAYGR